MVATNAIGPGTSAAAGPYSPTADVPGDPVNVTATPKYDGTVTVNWTPGDSGGLTVTGYMIVADSASKPGTNKTAFSHPDSSSSFTIARDKLKYDLNGGYRFTVQSTASNKSVSAESAPSEAAFPYAAPTFGKGATATASSGDGNITLTWTPAKENGRPVTYTVSCAGTCTGFKSPQEQTSEATSLTGLKNGEAYALTVEARNQATIEGAPPAALTVDKTVPHTAPTITSMSANSGSVTFKVDGNGLNVDCSLTAPTTQSGSCSSYNFSFAPTWSGTGTVKVCATNHIDPEVCQEQSVTVQKPPTLTVTVIAPTLTPYTNWLVRVATNTGATKVGTVNPGDIVTILCEQTGSNPYGSSSLWYLIDSPVGRGWISDGFYAGKITGSSETRVSLTCPKYP